MLGMQVNAAFSWSAGDPASPASPASAAEVRSNAAKCNSNRLSRGNLESKLCRDALAQWPLLERRRQALALSRLCHPVVFPGPGLSLVASLDSNEM